MYNTYSTPTTDPAAQSDWTPKVRKNRSWMKMFKNPVAVVVAAVGILSVVGVTLAAVVIPYLTQSGRFSTTPKQSAASGSTSCVAGFDITTPWTCGGLDAVPAAVPPAPAGTAPYIAAYQYRCRATKPGATYYFFAIRHSQSTAYELLAQGTSDLSPVVPVRSGEYVQVQCNPCQGSTCADGASVNQSCTHMNQEWQDDAPTPTPRPTVAPSPTPSPVAYRCNSSCTTSTQCSNMLGSNYTCYGGACRLIGNETSTTCAPTCNSACTSNSQCPTYGGLQLSCLSGRCRMPSNPSSTTCVIPTPSPVPSASPVTYTCNSACSTVTQCQTALGNAYTCYSGACRLASNPTSVSCQPAPTPSVSPSPSPISYTCNSSCTTGSVGNTQCQSSLGSAYTCYNGACRLTANPTSTTCTTAQVCQAPIKKDTGNYCKVKADGTLQNYVTFMWYRQQNVNQYEVDIERRNSNGSYSVFINNGWQNRSVFGSDCAYTTNNSEHCEYSVYLAPATYRARIKVRGTTAPVCTATDYVYTDPLTLGSCQ